MRRSGPLRRGLDMASLREGVSGPGMDTRTWLSYATVADDVQVEFDPDYGPLVTVALQPNKTLQRCRVLGDVAGDGEASYYPFVAGDEVLVLLPEGSERAGAVIIGRLNNSIDKFPTNVGGQDPAKNAFGFRRTKAPMIHESAGPMMWRSAISGAFLAIDTKGTVTLRDGQGGALQMSADAFSYQGPGSSPEFLFQLDLTGHRMTMQVGDALFTLAGSKASPQANAIATSGALSLSTAGNPSAEHAVSTEAVFNILSLVFDALATVLAPIGVPLTGTALGLLLKYPVASTTFLAAAPVLLNAEPFNPIMASAIFAAFQSASQKPPGVVGVGQTAPGIGCPGLIVG